MTPERQGPTAAGDGFVTYDELSGPDEAKAFRSGPRGMAVPEGVI